MEQYAGQFVNCKATVTKLAGYMAGMNVEQEAIAEKLKKEFEVSGSHDKLKFAIKSVVHAMLANCISSSDQPDDESKWPSACKTYMEHAKSTLGFSMDSLDHDFMREITAAVPSKASTKTKESTAGSSSTTVTTTVKFSSSSSGAGTGSATGSKVATPQEPAKKIEKLRQTNDVVIEDHRVTCCGSYRSYHLLWSEGKMR